MLNISFRNVIADSPLLSDEVKQLLIHAEHTLIPEAKQQLMLVVLGMEMRVDTAAQEFLSQSPKPEGESSALA